jgi:pimeloyl-ACP methyl ester carboxylesterase
VTSTEQRSEIFVPHRFQEQAADLGEVVMNYATTGPEERPALLLLPGQTESWWGYEAAMPLLAKAFQIFAVDLRGQGRTTRTPGRYTIDNMGNDLVRFMDIVIGRPAVVSGNSSGGVLAAWLAAYAKPGQVRAVVCEDPPLFASEANPAAGHSVRQAMGPMFALSSKWLGDQWSVGDWAGMQAAVFRELPPYILRALGRMQTTRRADGEAPDSAGPPQNMKEYDPEWGRAFSTGTVSASCDHARMLGSVKVPVLLTHHFREIDQETGNLMGALSDQQVSAARRLVAAAGQRFEYVDRPGMAHSMHAHDPGQFAQILIDWAAGLPDLQATP